MTGCAETIAVVQGAPGVVVQELFGSLIDRWRAAARIAGVVAESHGLADRACSAGFLRSIASGERFSIFQDMGPGSTACHLEGGGAHSAAEAVRRDIARGCDLVILSKFAKLETNGAGLADAFTAAMQARVPLLTSVSPAFENPWAAFAGGGFTVLPADLPAIDAWWRVLGAARRTSPLDQSALM